jgi:hypothetical protein
MLFYRAALPLSRQTLTYVAGIIRRHRRRDRLHLAEAEPERPGLLVLAYLRKGDPFAEIAAGFSLDTPGADRSSSGGAGHKDSR